MFRPSFSELNVQGTVQGNDRSPFCDDEKLCMVTLPLLRDMRAALLLATAVIATQRSVPELAAFAPVAPDMPLEVTSDPTAAKAMQKHHGGRFVVVMQAPRVGSKMLCSMLKSYDKGEIFVRMEGADSGLKASMPNSSVAKRIGVLLDEAERKGRAHVRRGAAAAVGFKTAKTLHWDADSQTYGPAETYDWKDAGPVWRKLGVRVLCLARLNGFAWALSGTRKSSKSDGAVRVDCSEGARRAEANKTLEHVRQFYGECRRLGAETRALWVPYEAVKDGSPRQKRAQAAVLDFLGLNAKAKLGADTPHFSPGASSAYVANADECRATLAPNPYLRAMLDDPIFPYGGVT